jgi:hypothetical protein
MSSSLGLFILGCAGSQNAPKIIGDEVHYQQSAVKSVSLNIANPRQVGEHYFKRNGSIGNRRRSATDVEVWDQSVMIYVFVALTGSDGPKLAVYPKKHGRFGTFGQVYEEWHEFTPENPVSAEVSWLQLPLHESIDKYIFVIRSLDEKTGWRIATVPSSELSPSKTCSIPDLLTLPQLANDVHESKYREMLKPHDVELK